MYSNSALYNNNYVSRHVIIILCNKMNYVEKYCTSISLIISGALRVSSSCVAMLGCCCRAANASSSQSLSNATL